MEREVRCQNCKIINTLSDIQWKSKHSLCGKCNSPLFTAEIFDGEEKIEVEHRPLRNLIIFIGLFILLGGSFIYLLLNSNNLSDPHLEGVELVYIIIMLLIVCSSIAYGWRGVYLKYLKYLIF